MRPLHTKYIARRFDSGAVALVRECGSVSILVEPARSIAVRRYSPVLNFGPATTMQRRHAVAQLALTILLDFLDNAEIAASFHRLFVELHISRWTEERHEVTGKQICEFLCQASWNADNEDRRRNRRIWREVVQS